MHFLTPLLSLLPLFSFLTTASPAPAPIASPETSTTTTPCPNPHFTTTSYQSHLVSNYLALWSGNLSLIPTVFSPNISVYQDRIPSASGSITFPIHNSTTYRTWIELSRSGWESYTFYQRYWLGSGYKIAIRWYLEAVVGANVTAVNPLSTLSKGDKVSYNGTDVLFVGKCSGLVVEVDSAQDFIDYFHDLGLKSVNV